MPKTRAEYQKTYYENQRKKGLCMHCPSPTIPKKKYCEYHRIKLREYASRYLQKRFERGLCIRCSQPREKERLSCKKHLKLAAKQTKARVDEQRSKGLCITPGCKKSPIEDRVFCRKHLKKLREQATAWGVRCKEKGICRNCSAELPLGRLIYCLKCSPTLDGLTLAMKRQKKLDTKNKQVIKWLEKRAKRNDKIKEWLKEAEISSRNKEIITIRFGIGKDRDQTLQYVADNFGLTRERIRQIIDADLGNLKNL